MTTNCSLQKTEDWWWDWVTYYPSSGGISVSQVSGPTWIHAKHTRCFTLPYTREKNTPFPSMTVEIAVAHQVSHKEPSFFFAVLERKSCTLLHHTKLEWTCAAIGDVIMQITVHHSPLPPYSSNCLHIYCVGSYQFVRQARCLGDT